MSSAKDKNILDPSSFRVFFDRLLARYAVSEDTTFKDWQTTIFFLIFLCTSILGIFTCVASMFLTIKLGKYYIAAFYFVVYMTFVLVTFGRFIPFRTRAWIGTGVYYILGLINLLKFGPVGSGRTWLFAFVIIACLTLGLRAGLFTLLIDGLTFTVIGWMLSKGVLTWEYSHLIQLKHWITTSITFLFLGTVVILPLSIVVSTRDQRLLREIKLTENLRRVNRQYKQENVERKLIEKELKESEEKFLKAFQTSPAAMVIISIEKRCFIEVNHTFRNIFGKNQESYIGESVNDADIWVDQSQKEYLCEALLQKQQPIKNFEISVYRSNRTICRGLFSADIINLKGKKFILAIMLDISEYHRNLTA